MKQSAASYENLCGTLTHIAAFTAKELEIISACFKPLTVKKNTILLAAGDVCKSFYFVSRGCIRTYYLTKEGQEKTRYVMLDYFIGTALTSFMTQKPTFELMDALEDSELLYISHADFYRLIREIPAWAEFYQKILEMAYTFQSRKIESRVTLTAKQRYDQVMQETPQLMQRLSNKMLASYLDVRQETLSRLKSH